MFKKIKIINFQVHQEKEIHFAPGITTIKGATDSGKSSIIRALRWVCLNDFAGEEFIREGASQAAVSVQVDSSIIRRRKGKGGNLYKLDKAVFKAFGRGSVPQEIESFLQIDEMNFQAQHDSPFWFSESAGEVSRQLNRIVDLSVIDTSLANVAGLLKRSSYRIGLGEERVDQLKQEIESLSSQEERVNEFKLLKERHEKLTQIQKHHRDLEELMERAGRYRLRIQQSIPDLSGLDQKFQAYQDTQESLQTLNVYLRSFHSIQKSVNYKKRKHQELEQQLRSVKLCPTCGQVLYEKEAHVLH